MNWTVSTYLAYLVVTVPLIVWVGSTLGRNGTVFLRDVFAGKDGLAEAVNQLLVVGFYLLNLGFVALFLRVGEPVTSSTGLVETLSVKVGVVMLVLGILHVANVLVFGSIRRRGHLEQVRSLPQSDPRYAGMPAYPRPQ